jgi:hypothetical protein
MFPRSPSLLPLLLNPSAPLLVVVQEVEDTLVEFLQRGATIETDILANVKAALPPEVGGGWGGGGGCTAARGGGEVCVEVLGWQGSEFGGGWV